MLDILKSLHISTPFLKTLKQLPTYVKFMKENGKKKRRHIKEPYHRHRANDVKQTLIGRQSDFSAFNFFNANFIFPTKIG